MKSVWASGRLPHFCWLAPIPWPKRPPLDSANSPWAGCQPGAAVVAHGVGEGRDAGQPLGVGRRERAGEDRDHQEGEREEPGRGADHPEHAEQDREEHQGGAEVVAEDDEAGGQEQAGHHRHHDLVEVAEPAVLVGVDVRGPQHQRELGDLGRLDHDRAEGEPVGVAVAGDAEERGEQQQAERDDVARPGEPAYPSLRQASGHPGARAGRSRPRSAA